MQAVNSTGYRWILYGDDDTFWFVGGVLDLLKDLDPDMPYIVTGDPSKYEEIHFKLAKCTMQTVQALHSAMFLPRKQPIEATDTLHLSTCSVCFEHSDVIRWRPNFLHIVKQDTFLCLHSNLHHSPPSASFSTM